jgi:hypothetical protein
MKKLKENEATAGHHPSEYGIQATQATHPTPTQHLEQQTERAEVVESNNMALPSATNLSNTNDKNQITAIIVDVNKMFCCISIHIP